ANGPYQERLRTTAMEHSVQGQIAARQNRGRLGRAAVLERAGKRWYSLAVRLPLCPQRAAPLAPEKAKSKGQINRARRKELVALANQEEQASGSDPRRGSRRSAGQRAGTLSGAKESEATGRACMPTRWLCGRPGQAGP